MTDATLPRHCGAAPWRGCRKWVVTAVIGFALPLLFRSGTALTLMSLMYISIVFALSYNMLLGQTGMLSFGHAVYFGFGAYVAIHCMNAVITHRLPVPLPIVPLMGGVGALLLAMVFGWICMFLMYKFTRTPVGRLCNAVRDNSDRAQFVGYNPQVVRFIAFCASGFFAGIAGGLATVHFEIANSAYFSAAQSANVLLATFIGGSSYFIGPVIGAALVTFLQVMLSDVTEIWQLYLGLLFIVIVMFAPQGIAGLLIMHRQLLGGGSVQKVAAAYSIAFPPALATFLGLSLLIEMSYRLAVKTAEGPAMTFLTIPISADDPIAWLSGGAFAIVGFALFRLTWPTILTAWAAAEPARSACNVDPDA